MNYRNLVSSLIFSALSFCSINAAFAQTSGLPSPIDGQPITDEPNFNLGFGDDDRIPMRSNAFPWSAIGRVQIDNGGHCTGALIGRDLVLTNAHCIWVEGQRRGITFAPNYKNGQSPETVRGINYWWGTSDPENQTRADWAIIRLERPIGDRYGWFGYQPLNYQELQGRTVTYAGYSTFRDEQRQEFFNGETAQVHIGCRVRDVFANDGVIHTDCDNGRGGSGGPIFIWQNNQPIIVGINAAEFRGESKVSFFTQNYTPGQGNVGVPTLTFVQAITEASNQQNSLWVRSFNGETFGEILSSQAVSGADRFRGWSWDGATASYVAFENGQSTLIVRPFNGTTLGPVTSTQAVSDRDVFRGWSWDGSRASYVTVDGNGRNILIIRPFNGTTLGPVTSTQAVSDRDVFRGWSWDGSRASYVTVDENGRNILIIRSFNGTTFGPVTSTQTVSDRDIFRGWSWDGSRASYVTK